LKVEPAAVELVGVVGLVVTAGGMPLIIKRTVAVSIGEASRSWYTATVGAKLGVEAGFQKLVIFIETCDAVLKVPEVSFMVSTPKV
jgi:hypothetical protein